MDMKFLNDLLKLIKEHKTEGKSKLYNKLINITSKTHYWKNMSLLQIHPVNEYKIKIFEWKTNNWIKLLNELKINMTLLKENRNIWYK